MQAIMVRYKITTDRVAENENPIRAESVQHAHKIPVGLRYALFRLPDGQSFAHVVSIETADGTNPLSQLAAKRSAVCGRSGPGAGP